MGQWELRLLETQENAIDQDVIVCSFASGWSRILCEFSGLITEKKLSLVNVILDCFGYSLKNWSIKNFVRMTKQEWHLFSIFHVINWMNYMWSWFIYFITCSSDQRQLRKRYFQKWRRRMNYLHSTFQVLSVIYFQLYNKLSYARILIGSHLWSIEGQTYGWRHH